MVFAGRQYYLGDKCQVSTQRRFSYGKLLKLLQMEYGKPRNDFIESSRTFLIFFLVAIKIGF